MSFSPDTIYVSNLPQTITESSLIAYFSQIGVIKHDKKTDKKKVWIYKTASNTPKGDATVTYDDPSSSDAAVEWFNGKSFEGNTISVSKATQKPFFANGGMQSGMRGRGRGRGSFSRGGGRDSGPTRESFNSAPAQGSSGLSEDWTCRECSNVNFAKRNECNRCRAPKSGGARESRGDRNDRGNDRGGNYSGDRERYSNDRGGDRYSNDRGGDRYSKDHRSRPY